MRESGAPGASGASGAYSDLPTDQKVRARLREGAVLMPVRVLALAGFSPPVDLTTMSVAAGRTARVRQGVDPTPLPLQGIRSPTFPSRFSCNHWLSLDIVS
jgi:hypothetical protein